MFIGRTDAKAETPVLWPPHSVKTLEPRRFSRVESGFSKTTGISGFLLGWPWEAQSSPGVVRESWAEDEMVGWHHRLDGHDFHQAPGVADGQGSLA